MVFILIYLLLLVETDFFYGYRWEYSTKFTGNILINPDSIVRSFSAFFCSDGSPNLKLGNPGGHSPISNNLKLYLVVFI